MFAIARYRENRKLIGIIYMHRISDPRMSGVSRRNFSLFRKLCGDTTLSSVTLVTNMWNLTPESVAVERESQLATSDLFFRPVLDKGARMMRHHNTLESGRKILEYYVGRGTVTLQIQDEVVTRGMRVEQTAAGEELEAEKRKEVEEARRKQEEEMRRTREALRAQQQAAEQRRQAEIAAAEQRAQEAARQRDTQQREIARQAEEQARIQREAQRQLEVQARAEAEEARRQEAEAQRIREQIQRQQQEAAAAAAAQNARLAELRRCQGNSRRRRHDVCIIC